jgi:hypothetical protein
MATKSNNGLLPIQNGTASGSANPMSNGYYNQANAPSTTQAMNYSSGNLATNPYAQMGAAGYASSPITALTNYTQATPTPPSGVSSTGQPILATPTPVATNPAAPAGSMPIGGSGVNPHALVTPAQQAGTVKAPVTKKPAPAPAKPQSAIDKWLAGDTTYQQQLAEYQQEQDAYKQNYTNTNDQINQNESATARGMTNQAALDRQNQQYDFAGRGVLTSGVYAKALDQYNTQFQNNMGNLVQGQNQQLQASNTNYNNYQRQVLLQQNQARSDAIARRAAQLGITG